MGSWKEDQKMRTIVLFLVTGSALARPRDVQDRLHPEEVKHILGIEDDELAPRQVPLDPQGRHVGAGLGLNVGPLGAGFSTGLGNGGLGLNGAFGIGNFQPWDIRVGSATDSWDSQEGWGGRAGTPTLAIPQTTTDSGPSKRQALFSTPTSFKSESVETH